MDIEMLIGMGFSFLMVLTVLLFVGGMVLLKPLMKNLGNYLESKAAQNRSLEGLPQDRWDRLFASLESMEKKIEVLEERQDFTERLLQNPENRDGA